MIIKVQCPICKASCKINVSDNIKNSEKIVVLAIKEAIICEHSFTIHIDHNFSIRGEYQDKDVEITKKDLVDLSVEDKFKSLF